MARVVGVGAFERDNFGDLLYAHLARQISGERLDLSLATPIASDMRDVLGLELPAVGEVLRDRGADGIWVVGGEVGATTPEYVYATRFGADALERLLAMGLESRRESLGAAMGGVLYAAPYIPRPSDLRKTQGATLVLTSVGVAGIATVSPERSRELAATLREAQYIAVRDPRSARVLSGLGIKHVIAPDIAHAVSRVYSPAASEGDYVLLHLPQAAVAEHGLDTWRDAIVELGRETEAEIRLFFAGTAPEHDSLDTITRLAAECQKLGINVGLSSARGVYPRIDEIAAGRLWVGGSLHGRIIAEAYGVPRVSLRKPKVDAYAEHWDPTMPYAVGPGEIVSAARAALRVGPGRDLSSSRSAAALESLERAIETLRTSN